MIGGIIINKETLAQIVSVVVTVSGVFLAAAAFVPVLSNISNYLLAVFVISVHLQPWVQDSNIWFRRLSILGLFVYSLTVLFRVLAPLVIIPVVTTLAVLWGGMVIGKKPSTDKPTQSVPQIPKPTSKQGAIITNFIYFGTQVLALLNPFQLAQMVAQIVGLVVVFIRYKGKLPAVDNYVQQVEYCLPVQGEWFVANGGMTKETSHSWDIFNQRYAYDLVKTDDKLSTHYEEGKICSDYYCYRQDIISPADGKVVKVIDGLRDAKRPGTMALDFLVRDFRGNHITIKHSKQEYFFLAHFIPGSITVKEGNLVEAGQVLGKCGNSGHSTEPHLHFHVQDSPNFFFAAGLPVKFSKVKVDGEYKKRVYLSNGQKVSCGDN